MIVLAIETSCARGGVAVLRDGKLIGERGMDSRSSRSAGLFRVVEELLEASCVEREDISGIGVDVGPGSFTGVRVGIAAAKGLSRGLGVPACGVTSLEALVSADDSGRLFIFPVVDARGGRFYGALFERGDGAWRQVTAIELWEPRGLAGSVPEGTRFFGPGIPVFGGELAREMAGRGVVAPEGISPSPAAVGRRAAVRLLEGLPSELQPVYLKSYIKKREG